MINEDNVSRFRNITEAPAYVFWFHNTRMINYGVGGVEVTANNQIISKLTICFANNQIFFINMEFFCQEPKFFYMYT